MFSILLFVAMAPIPKHLALEIAPPPRQMYPYFDDKGQVKYYARERIEDGVRKRVVKEGDPEFERRFQAIPARPNIIEN